MLGRMMDQQLLVSNLISHAARYHGGTEVISVETDGSVSRSNWAALEANARRLASALGKLGIQHQDRCATIAWNNRRHMEIYFGVSGGGMICHTINPRLHPEQLIYIVNHAEDQVMFVDRTFLPAAAKLAPLLKVVKHWVLLGPRDAEAEAMISLLIPVMKGFLTDKGFETTVLAQQTLGGSGFTREWGLEQFVRDARIAMIYEGTNGIQSLDLVGRKLPSNGGKPIMAFFDMVKGFIKENEGDSALKEGFLDPLKAASKDLQSAAMYFMQEGVKNPLNALSGSYDFMHLYGHVCLGLMWAKMAKAAQESLDAGAGDEEFYRTKIATGRYYMARQLPATAMHLARITSGAETVMALDAANF